MAYCLDAIAITSFLTMMLPLIGVLSIILHQETLQKALLIPKRVIPAAAARDGDWLDILMRCCVQALHSKGAVMCVIERTDSLEGMLNSAAPFNVRLTYPLLVKMLHIYEPTSFIWIKEPSLLIAIDAQWVGVDAKDVDSVHYQAHSWQRYAVLLTHKTDAIVICASGTEQLFTVVAQGTMAESVPVGTALRIIRRFITKQQAHRSSDEKNVTHAH
jgi:hypothetical protein